MSRKKRTLRSLIIPKESKVYGIWIARNNDGSIYGFFSIPIKNGSWWYYKSDKSLDLPFQSLNTMDWKNWHPEFTSDSEPIKLRISNLIELIDLL